MKSRTSFFNPTAFKKTITRFAPVWVLYTVFLLMVLFGIRDERPAFMARDVVDLMEATCWGNLIYAAIVALYLFGDLYNSRLCNALHAFPTRREGWLLTNLAAGVLFSLVPNLVMTCLTSMLLWEYASYVWIWLAVAMLQYLFFFGTAVLSALCAGNRLGMAANYGIFHFIVILLLVLTKLIYEPLLYGVEIGEESFYRFLPLYQMMELGYVETGYSDVGIDLVYLGLVPKGWIHLAICTAVGIVCMVLATLVYRRRQLERAGDFITVKPLAPVFLVIYTVAVGAVFYAFSEMIGTPSYLLMALGLAIGFFTGRMLLSRTLRVFSKRSVGAFVLLLAVIAGSLVLTWLDPLGVSRYVPDVDKVESAVIFDNNYVIVYRNDYDYEAAFLVTDREEVLQLQDTHRGMIEAGTAEEEEFSSKVMVQYRLKDGSVVNRAYWVAPSSPVGKSVNKWLSDARYIFQVNDVQSIYDLFDNVYIRPIEDGYYGEKEYATYIKGEIDGLLDAILADCAAGNMTQNWNFHRENSDLYPETFYVELRNERSADSKSYRYLPIWHEAEHTNAYLAQLLRAIDDQ